MSIFPLRFRRVSSVAMMLMKDGDEQRFHPPYTIRWHYRIKSKGVGLFPVPGLPPSVHDLLLYHSDGEFWILTSQLMTFL